jgi:hypothetical protein
LRLLGHAVRVLDYVRLNVKIVWRGINVVFNVSDRFNADGCAVVLNALKYNVGRATLEYFAAAYTFAAGAIALALVLAGERRDDGQRKRSPSASALALNDIRVR